MDTYQKALAGWKRLGDPAPASLPATRLELHYAVQPLSAAAMAHAEAQPDDSHTSISWDPATQAFLGQPLATGIRVALDVHELALQVRHEDGEVRETLPLRGKTLHEVFEELRAALGQAGGGAIDDRPLEMPTYDIPPHPLSEGARFEGVDPAGREELYRWYENFHSLLTVLSQKTLGASPVRCWPHHFDMATLITLDAPGGDPETARSINVGISPGDTEDSCPYFYCNPWPRVDADSLPPLAGGGVWHREGWLGTVLRAETIVTGSAAEQSNRVVDFLRSAMAAGRLLEDAL